MQDLAQHLNPQFCQLLHHVGFVGPLFLSPCCVGFIPALVKVTDKLSSVP